jgi:hypothetical protein
MKGARPWQLALANLLGYLLLSYRASLATQFSVSSSCLYRMFCICVDGQTVFVLGGTVLSLKATMEERCFSFWCCNRGSWYVRVWARVLTNDGIHEEHLEEIDVKNPTIGSNILRAIYSQFDQETPFVSDDQLADALEAENETELKED